LNEIVDPENRGDVSIENSNLDNQNDVDVENDDDVNLNNSLDNQNAEK
jgi:hypothetical protein